jgi:hypothetical protein
MKRRNPCFGCRRIAQQIAFVFGVEIDKDVVRRVLAKHSRPTSGSDGLSWLTFLLIDQEAIYAPRQSNDRLLLELDAWRWDC